MERKTQGHAVPQRSEELRGFAEALRKASPTSRRACALQGAKNRPPPNLGAIRGTSLFCGGARIGIQRNVNPDLLETDRDILRDG
jgi:hypothetical protein